MLKSLTAWLAGTRASHALQDVSWIIPSVQVIHILAIAIVLSSVVMIDLRIFGLAGARTTMSETARRYVPPAWGALVVLACSGAVLIVAEPGRSLINPVFQLKMVMLAAAVAVTAAFQVSVQRSAPVWDLAAGRGIIAKGLAIPTLLLWFAIAVAGRWIAYAANPDLS